jgi:hypothetical protein
MPPELPFQDIGNVKGSLSFGLLPVFWLPMDPLVQPSQSVAIFLVICWQKISAPKNWLANDWQSTHRRKPNVP